MADNQTTTAEQFVAKKVSSSKEDLLKLDSSAWAGATEYKVEMATTPLANQPSPYIKATRDEKEIGKVKNTTLKVLHNGKEIFFRICWASEDQNILIGDLDVFPDAVALLFPLLDVEETPIKEMGKADAPTNAWYWRADFENKPKNQVAEGLSTSLYTETSSILASSEWKDGIWTVVMGRAFEVEENAMTLTAGAKKPMGIAAWEGGNGERGGVKAFSKEWRDLVLA
jgi:DMSO reductase family type II enzyme heme b subunit